MREPVDAGWALSRSRARPLRHVAARDFQRVCGVQALLAETEAELTVLRQQARDQGWEAGMAQARQAQLESLAQQQQAFAQLCLQLDEALQPLLQQCLRQLLGELPLQDQLDARLRVLWEQWRPRGRLALRGRAETLERLRMHWRGGCPASGLEVEGRLAWHADAGLGPEDLILESEGGLADLRLQSQLDRVTACLRAPDAEAAAGSPP